jgi:hypothetical protein
MVAAVTPAQMRALQAGFTRLGYRRGDRRDRLAVAAMVLGHDQPLRSFSELQFGQAGYLLAWLRGEREAWDRASNENAAADIPQHPVAAPEWRAPEFGSDDAAGLIAFIICLLVWTVYTAPIFARQMVAPAAAVARASPATPRLRPGPAGRSGSARSGA